MVIRSPLLPAASFTLLLLTPGARGEDRPTQPATLLSRAATQPALSAADLDRLEQELQSPDAARRLAAAQAAAAAGPDGYEVYAARLLRPVTASTEVLRALVHGIWAQYPNPDYPKGPGKDPPMWLVRPEPRWVPPPRVVSQQQRQPRPRRPPPHDPDAVNWLTALAALDLSKDELTRGFPLAEAMAARADALLRVSLMRAIAGAGRAGRREAVYPLFDFAFVRDGLFRDECGRMIRSMDSYAVPALVRIYNDRTKSNAKMRRYASYQLDRMDRLRPSKAISTAPDDLTRADIIHAYGEARALDAVEAVLGQVDAASHRVRREARWTWLRYVDGPPPPPAPMRKRKLPGGQEESEEKEDYLNYREMATLAVAHALQDQLGHAPDASLSAREMTDRLFALYDQRRESEFAQLFASAKAKEAAGDLRGAVDEFGWILANQPDHPRRAEMAGAYRRLGEDLLQAGRQEDAKRPGGGDDPDSRTGSSLGRALGLLRQSVALDPAMPEAGRVMAEVHLADGQQAEAAGGDGRPDFRLALEADPSLPGARQALLAAQLRLKRKGRGAVPVGAALAMLVGGLLLLLRRRTAGRSADPTSDGGADLG